MARRIQVTVSFPCLFLLAVLMAVSAVAEDKRPITEKDIFQFHWVADPQMSPDGSQVVFVQVNVNEKDNKYENSIWAVGSGGNDVPRRLTNGPRDSQPRWSPDGKRLAFQRVVEKDGKAQPGQIYILNFIGGEPWALTSLTEGAGGVKWSPDGSHIALESETTQTDVAKANRKSDDKAAEEKEKAAKPNGRDTDVRVIARAVYRRNGGGYGNPKRHGHIWVVSVPVAPDGSAMPTPKQLTSDNFDEGDVMWSPDSKTIYYNTSHIPEPYYELGQDEIYSVPADGGTPIKIFTMQGSIDTPVLNPDGKRIAFRGSLNQPIRSYTQEDLWVIELSAGAQAKNLTADFDWDIGGGPGGDQHPPRGGGDTAPVWSKDGKSILDVVLKEGSANLYGFDANSGKATSITNGKFDIINFSTSEDRSKTAVAVSTPTNIGDVFISDASGKMTQLSHVNEKLFSQLKLTDPEEIWYTSFDGRKIQAWVQKPPDFDATKKYPLILNIHGGPHTAYGYTFDHEFQWMAAKGYVVLYPNPRGSTSYGQEFGNIIQHKYPGDDFKDLMAGVDELIKRGMVDPEKLGVTGGSGGGVLTNWAIGQTDRFKAAVSQRSIADWSAWWYTADFTLFHPSWFKGAPFEDPADFKARSPLTNIAKVKTPLMLIEGEADLRTPPTAGGEMMFRALKYLKRPVVMVRFPSETHELSRSGQPWHRVERLQHIVNWFDIYLMGIQVPGYEANPVEE